MDLLSSVCMLVWYEIILTGQSLFYGAFKLRKSLCTPAEADPRIHVLTAGDFPQLLSCFEKYLFEAPAFMLGNSANALPANTEGFPGPRYTVKNCERGEHSCISTVKDIRHCGKAAHDHASLSRT